MIKIEAESLLGELVAIRTVEGDILQCYGLLTDVDHVGIHLSDTFYTWEELESLWLDTKIPSPEEIVSDSN